MSKSIGGFEYKNGSSESEEQKVLFDWAALQSAAYPDLKFMYHVPNEGKRTKYTGNLLKREGLKKGVPDICLPTPKGKYHGLYIEMKFGKNKPTKDQLEYLVYLGGQGYRVAVCYSAAEAIDLILEYLRAED